MATEYTETDNLGLSLYGDNDPADLRDGYNASMNKLDEHYGDQLNRIEGLESRETHDEEVIKAALGDNTIDAATAAKTKWDKAADIATDDNKNKWDKAADIATDDNKNKWDKAANYTTKKALENSHFVFIGDSITAESSPNFSSILSTAYAATSHVFAQGGAGWIHVAPDAPTGRATIPNLIDASIADNNFPHDKVTIVVVLAGVNDFPANSNDVTEISNAVSTSILKLRSEFANAKIINGAFLGGEFAPNHSIANGNDRYTTVMLNINNTILNLNLSNVVTYPAWNWLGHKKSYYKDDGLHPNKNGHAIIAGQLRNIFEGGAPVDNTVEFLANELFATASDGSVEVNGSHIRSVARLSADASVANCIFNSHHLIDATDEISSDKHTLKYTIGILQPWFKMSSGSDNLTPISGACNATIQPWIGDASFWIERRSNDNRILLKAWVYNASKEFAIGQDVVSSVGFSFNLNGINLEV